MIFEGLIHTTGNQECIAEQSKEDGFEKSSPSDETHVWDALDNSYEPDVVIESNNLKPNNLEPNDDLRVENYSIDMDQYEQVNA